MVDIGYLKELISLLKSSNCSRIKMAGLEVEIATVPGDSPILTQPSITPLVHPDFKADDLMSEDKILNWSSPDAQADDLPLTMAES